MKKSIDTKEIFNNFAVCALTQRIDAFDMSLGCFPGRIFQALLYSFFF